MKDFVGKYICKGESNGAFCWAKIKGSTEINSIAGKKKAFIVTDRISLSGPDVQAFNGSSFIVSRSTKDAVKSRKVRIIGGDTLIPFENIDLEGDIFEQGDMFRSLSDDDLFLLVLEGKPGEENGLNQGIRNAMDNTGVRKIFSEVAEKEMKRRMVKSE